MVSQCNVKFSFLINYIDIFCCCIIFICILLIYMSKRVTLLNRITKKLICLMPVIIFVFFMFLPSTIINNKKINKYQWTAPQIIQLQNQKYEIRKSIKLENITKNKVIIVGDSRMELIENSKDKIKIPINFEFIAKSGASNYWFNEIAFPKILDKLNHKDTRYKYHVIINMGVNDIQYSKNFNREINLYLEKYNKLLMEYSDVQFYLLSINPINEKKLKLYQPNNVRTTKMIEFFNKKLKNNVKTNKFNNIIYCNSYDSIYFKTDDGIHYTDETNQEIIDYISKKCLTYLKNDIT